MGNAVRNALRGALSRPEQAAVVGILFRRVEDAHIGHLLLDPIYRRALDAVTGDRMELCVTTEPLGASDAAHIDPQRVRILDADDTDAVMRLRSQREQEHLEAYNRTMQSGHCALMTMIPPFNHAECLALCQLIGIDTRHDFPCLALLFPVNEEEVLATVVPIQGDSTASVFNGLKDTLCLVAEVVDGFDAEHRKNAESLHREVSGALRNSALKNTALRGFKVVEFVVGFAALALDLKDLVPPVRR